VLDVQCQELHSLHEGMLSGRGIMHPSKIVVKRYSRSAILLLVLRTSA
jgi:hypothetical protein